MLQVHGKRNNVKHHAQEQANGLNGLHSCAGRHGPWHETGASRPWEQDVPGQMCVDENRANPESQGLRCFRPKSPAYAFDTHEKVLL